MRIEQQWPAWRRLLMAAPLLAASTISAPGNAGLFGHRIPVHADDRAAAPPSPSDPTGLAPSADGVSRLDMTKVAAEGLSYLRHGDIDKARRLFNVAIKFDSQNGYYHLLVGVAYHLEYLRAGPPEARDNAMAGYHITDQMLPASPWPKLQAGRLELDSKHYDAAANAFSGALELAPHNPDALAGLASASYMQGDLRTALWAANELDSAHWQPATVARMRALMYSVLGESAKSREFRDTYAASLPKGARDVDELDARLADNTGMVEARRWLTRPVEAVGALAQVPDQGPASSPGNAPDKLPVPAPDISPSAPAGENAAMDALQNNMLYKNFKSNDLIDTDWAAAGKLSRLANEFSQILYH